MDTFSLSLAANLLSYICYQVLLRNEKAFLYKGNNPILATRMQLQLVVFLFAFYRKMV